MMIRRRFLYSACRGVVSSRSIQKQQRITSLVSRRMMTTLNSIRKNNDSDSLSRKVEQVYNKGKFDPERGTTVFEATSMKDRLWLWWHGWMSYLSYIAVGCFGFVFIAAMIQSIIAARREKLISEDDYEEYIANSSLEMVKQILKEPDHRDVEKRKIWKGIATLFTNGLNIDASNLRVELGDLKDGVEYSVLREHSFPMTLSPLANRLRKSYLQCNIPYRVLNRRGDVVRTDEIIVAVYYLSTINEMLIDYQHPSPPVVRSVYLISPNPRRHKLVYLDPTFNQPFTSDTDPPYVVDDIYFATKDYSDYHKIRAISPKYWQSTSSGNPQPKFLTRSDIKSYVASKKLDPEKKASYISTLENYYFVTNGREIASDQPHVAKLER